MRCRRRSHTQSPTANSSSRWGRRSTSWRSAAPVEVARGSRPAPRHDHGGGCRRCRSGPTLLDTPAGVVVGGVVAVLRPRQPINPRTGPITCDTAQIHSNHLVDHLRLTVCLRMERCAHAQGDARHLEEVMPHMAGADRIPVADDRRREAVEPYNAVEERPGDRDGGVGVAERDEVGVLGEAIDHRQDD